MKTKEDCEKEIEALKAELERLRGGAALMTVAGAQPVSGVGENFTIHGLDEMILVADSGGEIAYVNDRMAQLLGIPSDKRKKAIGSKVTEWDEGVLGEMVMTLLSAAKDSGQNYVVEREFPDLGADRLPSIASSRVKDSPLIRFICTAMKDKVQIIAQDTTHTNWLMKNFSRYVSPGVMDRMRDVPEDELMKTERRVATVLFADLRGFTRACQELEPDQVVEMVNSFLSSAVEAIETYEGMVDKFVGDEIMALFGIPLSCPDHALRGLMAANDLVAAHGKWISERRAGGMVAPGVGVGVVSGEVIVGNIGAKSRLDYTVLGHNVNLAARLCGKAEAGEILTVRSTHNMAKEGLNYYSGPGPVPRFHFDKKGQIELKNILKPVEIITVTT